MSPQLRQACLRGGQYDAFKADVFALGASILHMTTLTSPEPVLAEERLDAAVGRELERLACSKSLKDLLRSMLVFDESRRPTMQEICFHLSQKVIEVPKMRIPVKVPKTTRPASNSIQELVQITATFLRFFDCTTSTWGSQVSLECHIIADENTRWVALEDGRLFCNGGACNTQDPGRNAYLLSRNGEVEKFPNMSYSRFAHGNIQVDSFIYTFGGCKLYTDGSHYIGFGDNYTDDDILKTCEKIDLEGYVRRWADLPSMQYGRGKFNPCWFHELLYLCGSSSSQMETFSPQTDLFLPYVYKLPEYESCCSYVHNNLLVVHSRNTIVKFTEGQSGQLVQHSQVRTKTTLGKNANSQPVVDATRGCFFIFKEHECLKINMKTGELIQSFE